MAERQKQHMGRSAGDDRELRGRDVAADDATSGDGARASEALPDGRDPAVSAEGEGLSERSQGGTPGR